MGCCSSVPSQEQEAVEAIQSTSQQHNRPEPLKKPEVTITRASSSLHSLNNVEKSSTSEEINSLINNNSLSTWPIFVRLSSNGQDITIQVPTQPPYLTVGGLRQAVLPHLEKNARVKLIYLGRILPDQHVIVPTQTDADVPLPPPKNRAIQIQKEGVIQAMVLKQA